MNAPLKEFANANDAFEWLKAEVDDPCVDNERFAFADDAIGMALFEEQERNGCCGSFECKILVAGRLAWIGCNYGH